jgi:succinate-semialdehyde dehydrogenase/glutarate-semialdehyde dehydrogenase
VKTQDRLCRNRRENIKKTVLELGGNDPFIVLKMPILIVQRTYKRTIVNNGQGLRSIKRFIVMEEVADEFLEKFPKKMEALKLGDPMNKDTQLGPLSSQDALDTLLEQVNTTKQSCYSCNRWKTDMQDVFMQPTILTDLKPNMLAYQENYWTSCKFYRVKSEEETITLANAWFGSIFSKDLDRAKK